MHIKYSSSKITPLSLPHTHTLPHPSLAPRHNYVHHSLPYFMYGHGIYLDEGASGIVVEKNWVHSAFSALFMQHYGVNNTVRHNVFARSIGGCLSYPAQGGGTEQRCAGYLWDPAYRGQACNYDFHHNIVAMAGTQGYVRAPPEGRCNGTWARNIYYNSSGPITSTFPGVNTRSFPSYPALNFRAVNASFAQWRLRGEDGDSAEADPQFISPHPEGDEDFRVKESSPALALGFEQVDLRVRLRKVGPDW